MSKPVALCRFPDMSNGVYLLSNEWVDFRLFATKRGFCFALCSVVGSYVPCGTIGKIPYAYLCVILLDRRKVEYSNIWEKVVELFIVI